ncbi:peptidoglycan DD-metalloendopeptidase family protein [Paenibacillus sp. SC116]|uniref:M23 family metallopeptidase n=1 Tax=Paenibacillus sp. SC116 TaxID=2968986 RepID=UPI00215B490B|nr:peptidoglycan DD-metalloendopeptidase family protein [Paenibacillus sp. SC116]MCR8844155.1 peptidoglycan DD-metalloendopeptidase family protein [Paenibacillus sp. SC116]
MKRRWWKQSTTLLVIREAEQEVKQVKIPKLLIVSVPIAAVMSLSGFILHLEWKSAQQIQELEEQLSKQAVLLDVTVKNKDQAVNKLQQEIIRLSKETENVKQRVSKISHWERQLEQFVQGNKNQLKDAPAGSSSRSTLPISRLNSKQQGGDLQALTDEQLLKLSHRSQFDLQEVNKLITEMERSLPTSIKQAKKKQAVIQGTPSLWPTQSQQLTSGFGYRKDPITGQASFHAGVDIAGEIGDSIYAAAEGTITTAEDHYARGNYIIISHVNGLETWYMHLNRIHVRVGDHVAKGDKIGELGNTGRSTGPHLHFQVMQRGEATNPYTYIGSSASSPTSHKPHKKIDA